MPKLKIKGKIDIDEAIHGLKDIYSELSTPGREKDWLALLLGIEALKVLCHGRQIRLHYDPILLPGETE